MSTSSPYLHTRLYTVEFLRVFFILIIVAGHALQLVPDFADNVKSFFRTTFFNLDIAVEYFFIIGGFFLYRRANFGTDVWAQIKKTYWRLMPCMMFALLLCVVLHIASFSKVVPKALTMTYGIGFEKKDIFPYGGWFLCTYFWVSCFLITLFSRYKQTAWLILGICMYAGFCMMVHVPREFYHTHAFFGVIGEWVVRGILSMGLGMVGGFLSEKMQFTPQNKVLRLLLTILEGYLLLCVWNSIMNPKHCHYDYQGLQILFTLIMVSISHSWGYISLFLNRAAWIQKISRYTLPTLMGSVVILLLLLKNECFGMSGPCVLWCVIIGGAALGVMEYHLVENSPWLRRIRETEKKSSIV